METYTILYIIIGVLVWIATVAINEYIRKVEVESAVSPVGILFMGLVIGAGWPILSIALPFLIIWVLAHLVLRGINSFANRESRQGMTKGEVA